MTDQPHGLARGLTTYSDTDFSLHLRLSFAKSMGYSRAMLARPRGLIGDGSPADPADIVGSGVFGNARSSLTISAIASIKRR